MPQHASGEYLFTAQELAAGWLRKAKHATDPSTRLTCIAQFVPLAQTSQHFSAIRRKFLRRDLRRLVQLLLLCDFRGALYLDGQLAQIWGRAELQQEAGVFFCNTARGQVLLKQLALKASELPRKKLGSRPGTDASLLFVRLENLLGKQGMKNFWRTYEPLMFERKLDSAPRLRQSRRLQASYA